MLRNNMNDCIINVRIYAEYILCLYVFVVNHSLYSFILQMNELYYAAILQSQLYDSIAYIFFAA